MRAILAGGGTGGHVIPALAIARELQQRYHAELLFIGTARGIENRLVPAAGFGLRLIQVGALKNVSVATRLRTLVDLPRAILACGRILGDFRPNVVIGVGGYASGPAMLAAWLRRLPTLAFEPNVVPGFANRAVARLVSAAAVHFEETRRYFPNAQVTGVPVRQEFFLRIDRAPRPRPTLLVFGGSQGASAINKAMLESLSELRKALPELHIIHQTGERDYKEAQAAYLQAGSSAEVLPFINDMPQAFARADLLLCRSGASTVAEITAGGKAAVFVPFPHAADNHQLRNAQTLVQHGAALIIPQSELSPPKLVSTLVGLFNHREQLHQMELAAQELSHRNAAEQIAEMVAQLAKISVASKSAETVNHDAEWYLPNENLLLFFCG
jgi:UDP-N-acetylglucosamine--N-acetylmuramyl-(pentapeptide) pyrophosphoryl-undecaprenol N-acetylglucosamine transferase